MRRSAPTSVAIGTMLDVGASMTKNHAPRYPSRGAPTQATTAAATSVATKAKCDRDLRQVSGRGHP